MALSMRCNKDGRSRSSLKAGRTIHTLRRRWCFPVQVTAGMVLVQFVTTKVSGLSGMR